jgi:hypothetical protein
MKDKWGLLVWNVHVVLTLDCLPAKTLMVVPAKSTCPSLCNNLNSYLFVCTSQEFSLGTITKYWAAAFLIKNCVHFLFLCSPKKFGGLYNFHFVCQKGIVSR